MRLLLGPLAPSVCVGIYMANYTSWSDRAEEHIWNDLVDKVVHLGVEHHLREAADEATAKQGWAKAGY